MNLNRALLILTLVLGFFAADISLPPVKDFSGPGISRKPASEELQPLQGFTVYADTRLRDRDGVAVKL